MSLRIKFSCNTTILYKIDETHEMDEEPRQIIQRLTEYEGDLLQCNETNDGMYNNNNINTIAYVVNNKYNHSID